MNYPTLDQLVQSGVHFGHRASRWNPKMKPFIFATRNSIHIINLEKTQEMLKGAMEYLKDVTAKGGTILFVGTKRQARNIVKQAAQSCGMPYVTVRWLGGTFTNFRTIQKTIRKLEELYHKKEDEDYEAKYTKKERLTIDRQIQKMETFFEGIKTMKKLPDAIFVVDINHEKIAVREAANVGVKVVAITDTNVDPENVNYLIPANDDATKSISLIVNLAAEAVKEGRGSSPVVPVAEKTADTEKNLKA